MANGRDDIEVGIGVNVTGEQELGSFNTALGRTGQAFASAAQNVKPLESAAKQVGQQFESLAQSARPLESSVKQVQQQFDNLARAVKSGEMSVEQAADEWVQFKNSLPDDELRRVADGVEDVARQTQRAANEADTAKGSWRGWITDVRSGMELVGQAFSTAKDFLVGMVETLKEGAGLQDLKEDYQALAATFNTTGDALLTSLKAGTAGLLTDVELMGIASRLMNEGLVGSADELTRIVSLSAELGLDVDTVAKALNTMSSKALVEFGLNVQDTKARIEELKDAGLSASEAFKAAVFEGLDKQIAVVGKTSETAEGKILALENAWVNVTDAFKIAFSEGVTSELTRLTGSVDTAALSLQENSRVIGETIGVTTAKAINDLGNLITVASDWKRIIALLNADPGELRTFSLLFATGDEAAVGTYLSGLSRADSAREESVRSSIDLARARVVERDANLAAAESSEQSAGALTNLATAADHLARIHERESGFDPLGSNLQEDAAARVEEMAAAAERYTEAVRTAIDETRALYAEAASRGGDTFMDAIANQRDWQQPDLVSPARDLSFRLSGGATPFQAEALERYEEALKRTGQELYDLQTGFKVVGDSAEDQAAAIAAAHAEMRRYQGAIEALGITPAVVGQAHQELAFDMEEVQKAILATADASGASAPMLADLGVALFSASEGAVGFDQAMADAAVKAAIFQEALGILTEGWKMGELDTSEFLAAVDELVTDLETKTVAQIRLEIVPPERGENFQLPWGDDFTSFWPEEARQIKIEADISPVEEALAEAMGLIEGVPLEHETVLTVNNDDVITKVGVSTDAVFGFTDAEHLGYLTLNQDDVPTQVGAADTTVAGFVNAEHLATLTLNIDSVRDGVTEATDLLASLPSSKTISLYFSSNIGSITSALEEARRAGALP